MRYRERLVAFTAIFTATACDRVAPPTAALDATVPSLATGAGRLRTFRIPTDNSRPVHITRGSDGNMWFTMGDDLVTRIGRVDAKGKITEFVVLDRSSFPDDIVSGPDGALWFIMPSGFPDVIGRLTTDGQYTGFDPRCNEVTCSGVPQGITSGPDGNLWFTDNHRNAVVKLTPAGVFTFYELSTLGANPHGITVGPEGALWFTEFNVNTIGRITTDGVITEFRGVSGSPDRITLGPDGNLWFTEPFPFDHKIGRITPAGVITEFELADRSEPRDIVSGPDGNLWFTDYAGALSRITPAGEVTVVESIRGGPWGIGRGPGNEIWLTLVDGNKVGRFTITP